MENLTRLLFGVLGFLTFTFVLIIQSFMMTTSYLEMTNLYDRTVIAANTTHELTTSKRVINEIALDEREDEVYLYNQEAFKKTFMNLMELTQVNVSHVSIGRDNDYIEINYQNGNSAVLLVDEIDTDSLVIDFEYNIQFAENIDITIDREIPVIWDVKRKAGEY